MKKKVVSTFVICMSVIMVMASAGYAIEVTQTDNISDLETALTGGNTGIQVISSTLTGDSLQTGTFTNASKVYSTKGLDSGIVLSSGKAEDFSDGPNTLDYWSTDFNILATDAQNALLTPISGEPVHYDPVQWDILFTVSEGYSTLYFNMAFGSDEYPEYQSTQFEDAFGIFLNGVNIAYAGHPGEANLPINISHPWMNTLVGTELDGVMTAQFQANPLLNGDENTLTFILSDASDGVYDTTVYLSALGAEIVEPPDDSEVPEPSSLVVMIMGGMSTAAFILRRK